MFTYWCRKTARMHATCGMWTIFKLRFSFHAFFQIVLIKVLPMGKSKCYILVTSDGNKLRIRLNCCIEECFWKVLLRISFYYNWIIKSTSICFRQILSLDGSDTRPHSLYLTIVTVVIIVIMNSESPRIEKAI